MTNQNNQPASAGPILMHIDGSCLGNPGAIGWAYHIQWPNGSTTEKSNGALKGTNNGAELRSCIDGLKATPEGSQVEVFTDSDYTRLGATVWSPNWIKNNWKNAQRKPVKNKELWLELLALMETREVTFERVAGHSGDPLNDRVDELAKEAAEEWESRNDF